MLDNNKILAALREVKDPVTGQDIIQSRRVRDLKIDDNQVYFVLNAAGLESSAKSNLHFACIEKIQSVYPEVDVHIHMESERKDIGEDKGVLPHVKNVIAVASGKGGVGKSTISVNLALALKEQGAKVGFIDADLYGPSIPTMLGLKGTRPQVTELYGKAKMKPLNAFGMPVISIGFIVDPEQAVVLRGPRLSGIVKQFIQDVIWPELDYLIIDLPPGTGDIQLTLVQTIPLTGAVIVTTPQEVAVADALKAMNMFRIENINVPIIGVVENMSWFTPEDMPNKKYLLFGEGGGKRLAKMGNTVLLGQIPLVEVIRERSDTGQPAVLNTGTPVQLAFDQLAKETAKMIAYRNEHLKPTQSVDVNRS